jgi:hypothetical protein
LFGEFAGFDGENGSPDLTFDSNFQWIVTFIFCEEYVRSGRKTAFS